MTINSNKLSIPNTIVFTLLSFMLLNAPLQLFGQDCNNDTEPPSFVIVDPLLQNIAHGDSIFYQCGEQDTYYKEQLDVTDNCDQQPELLFSKALTTGNCAEDDFMFSVNYCWKGSDDAGNTSEFCITVVINDNVDPTFIDAPADLTVDLTAGEILPSPDPVIGFDECHGYLDIDYSETKIPDADSCGYTLLRVWTTTDGCGNTGTTQQKITVIESCAQQHPCVSLPFDLQVRSLADCDDKARICLDYPLGQALLYDISINGLPYNDPVDICEYDTVISYGFFALPGNGMDGPYDLQSWVVDGDSYGGTFDDVFELTDLMNMIDPDGNWSLDTVTLSISSYNTGRNYGTLTVFHPQSTDLAVLSLNSATAPVGSAIHLPTGEHQVKLVHQDIAFCTDTFTAVVHCVETGYEYNTVTVSEGDKICIDEEDLPGSLQSLEVVCDDCDNLNADVEGACVVYQGLSTGIDSVLIIACDNYQICDSTWLIVTVAEDYGLPVARVDTWEVQENQQLIIDALANDDINGQLKFFGVIILPHHGSVSTDIDLNFIYTPDEEFCGIDAFAYQLCNESGCDTSTVNIDVTCNRLVVYTGFSPNKDGINDYFKIGNISQYPDNELKVYNRWGNLVYRKVKYQNDWDGTDITNKQLTDGTYFYMLDTGGGEMMKGYLQINR